MHKPHNNPPPPPPNVVWIFNLYERCRKKKKNLKGPTDCWILHFSCKIRVINYKATAHIQWIYQGNDKGMEEQCGSLTPDKVSVGQHSVNILPTFSTKGFSTPIKVVPLEDQTKKCAAMQREQTCFACDLARHLSFLDVVWWYRSFRCFSIFIATIAPLPCRFKTLNPFSVTSNTGVELKNNFQEFSELQCMGASTQHVAAQRFLPRFF